MPDIRPFRAVTFDTARAGDFAKLVAEPYDKVTETMRAEYLKGSPYNVVRVDLPREAVDGKDRYATAASVFRGWLSSGILQRDARPAFYVYDQTFELPGEKRCTRRSFIGLVEAREHAKGHVLPHEKTFREPKADRLALMEAARAHFGMCFLLYEDPEKEVARALATAETAEAEALADFKLPDGTTHMISRIDEPGAVAALRQALAARTCTIADGHHRYETAIAFRRDHEKKGDFKPAYAYRLAAFVDVAEPGLKILPTHRLLPKETTVDSFMMFAAKWLMPAPAKDALFSIAWPDGSRMGVKLRPEIDLAQELPDVPPAVRGLPVTILHRLVLERGLGIEAGSKEHALGYVRWPEEGQKKIDAGAHGAMVVLKPTAAKDVLAVAEAGAVMPQKSTDFYPKLLSGLIMNDIEDTLHGT